MLMDVLKQNGFLSDKQFGGNSVLNKVRHISFLQNFSEPLFLLFCAGDLKREDKTWNVSPTYLTRD